MQRNSTLTRAELREQRLQALLESCRDQILQQVIGPFGLNPAMFNDKQGGNVTTTHNFEAGVTATEQDRQRYNAWQNSRHGGYDRTAYDDDLPGKRKEIFKGGDSIFSAYTGKELPRDGQTHLDHVIAAKTLETSSRANLYLSKEERVATANAPENLVPAESSINQSMQDKDKREWADSPRKKDPGKSNAQSFGINRQRLEKTVATAEKHVSTHVLLAQMKKQGSELAVTGAKEAGRNALRQAIGVALHTFVSEMFIELKRLFDCPDGSNLVDDLIAATKRVLDHVMAKLRTMLDAGIGGGIQAFVSNLLTFLINNFITTSAKIVTAIREGMMSLWQAIKIMASPPPGMTGLEIAREVSKIIAGIVTTSFGLLFEEAIKAMLTTAVPFLAPLMEIIAPAVTAILVGVVSALVVYGLDRLFDWLSDTGTALLQAMQSNLEALSRNLESMAQWVEQQYLSSERYAVIRCDYQLIEVYLAEAEEAQRVTIERQRAQIHASARFMGDLRTTMTESAAGEQQIVALLESHPAKDIK